VLRALAESEPDLVIAELLRRLWALAISTASLSPPLGYDGVLE